MATYHFRVKILSRSSGRSGVAAAAFRARTRIYDDRQGLTFNYSRYKDLVHSEIMLPVEAPEWMKDRPSLWNAVEAGERRKDAQIFREVEIALPRELDGEQRIALVREFVKDNYLSKGMVADINLHMDRGNPHAHILLTMRDIVGDEFGQKNRSWNRRALINQWRKSWADIQNQHLQKAGYDITVDHRSFIDRGINLEPQIRLGVSLYDSGDDITWVKESKRIKSDNGKRIAEDPKIALRVLGQYSALFTDEDIHRFVRSHSEGTEQFQTVCDAIYGCNEIITLGPDGDGLNRYTTKSLVRTDDRGRR